MLKNRNILFTVNHLAVTLRTVAQNVLFQSTDSLGVHMKQLNDAKNFKEALSLFDSRKSSNTSDLSINQALKACIHLGNFQHGLAIHKSLTSRSLKCRHIQMSLVQLHMRIGDVAAAQRVFSSVPINQRTPFLYTAMLNGLVWHNRLDEALVLCENMTVKPDPFILTIIFDICAKLTNEKAFVLGRRVFSQMDKSHRQNTTVMTAALNMFMSNSDVDKAEELFHAMKTKDHITYGAMMKGYTSNDNPLRALALFEQLKKNNMKLDHIICVLAINACSKIGMIEYCRSTVAQIPTEFLNNQILQNALIDMWGKAGLFEEAHRVFQSIQNPDPFSFSTMINAFGLNGQGSQAVDLYTRMPEQMRNEITHVCVLNACSHSGLLKEARSIFEKVFPKTTNITTAMVDCLSRLHKFDEAQNLVSEYERHHPPFSAMYLSMMSGARTQCNIALSEKLFTDMKTRFPDETEDSVSALILLGNTYSSNDNANRSSDIKRTIQNSRVKPQIGQSWTCINNRISVFRANDWFHLRSEEIHQEVRRLMKEIVEHGHKFDRRWITRSLSPGETIESVLSTHSERLAIAFNFIQKSVPSPIQVTKNLRLCGDCHAAIKLIARIRRHPIIVRDANRVHHFGIDGQCSCGDYF